MIPALLLTAGLATRLRPLSSVRAKAALPVAGEPLARRIITHLAGSGVADFVLNLHHLPHTLTSRLGDGSDLGVRIRYSWESPAVLGSAGGPRHALGILGSPTFLIVNGDTLTDLDVTKVIARHRDTRALVTMAVVPNTQPQKYGGVVVTDAGVVTGFVSRGSTQPSCHFVGVQVANAEAFASLADNTPHESVGALYPALIRERPGSVRAFVTQAEFFDIGTAADYLASSLLLGARDGVHAQAGARTRIADDARVERSILWDDVEVGAGALVHDCIVTDGVRLAAGSEWRGVTIRQPPGELDARERLVDGLAVSLL